jgi:hypothetical protein
MWVSQCQDFVCTHHTMLRCQDKKYNQCAREVHGSIEQSCKVLQQQWKPEERVKQRKKAWTFFHSQQITFQEGGIQVLTPFLLQLRERQEILEGQCSCPQACGYDREQDQRFPNKKLNGFDVRFYVDGILKGSYF